MSELTQAQAHIRHFEGCLADALGSQDPLQRSQLLEQARAANMALCKTASGLRTPHALPAALLRQTLGVGASKGGAGAGAGGPPVHAAAAAAVGGSQMRQGGVGARLCPASSTPGSLPVFTRLLSPQPAPSSSSSAAAAANSAAAPPVPPAAAATASGRQGQGAGLPGPLQPVAATALRHGQKRGLPGPGSESRLAVAAAPMPLPKQPPPLLPSHLIAAAALRGLAATAACPVVVPAVPPGPSRPSTTLAAAAAATSSLGPGPNPSAAVSAPDTNACSQTLAHAAAALLWARQHYDPGVAAASGSRSSESSATVLQPGLAGSESGSSAAAPQPGLPGSEFGSSAAVLQPDVAPLAVACDQGAPPRAAVAAEEGREQVAKSQPEEAGALGCAGSSGLRARSSSSRGSSLISPPATAATAKEAQVRAGACRKPSW